MILKQLKIAGFKSFAEPTTLTFISHLTGIVGPNGCGKSNVIDAVRWVLGESSSRHLRSDSLADVVFKGSGSRKPLGQASVELVFDNTSGKIGGMYQTYSEISIKRVITSDGESNYYLNGSRCRRKDVTDIFLGTGLGARTYSIIEQGTISQFVEAKPEELRSYLEEAAGVSKYKERRRETSNRIKHTLDNLNRINDIKEELHRQIEKIQKQAKAAEKYKAYKEQERSLKTQWLLTRRKRINQLLQETSQALQVHDQEVNEAIKLKKHLENTLFEKREFFRTLEEERDICQKEYYESQSEVKNIEQFLINEEEKIQQIKDALESVKAEIENYQSDLRNDEIKLENITAKLTELNSNKPQVKSPDQNIKNQLHSLDVAKAASEENLINLNQKLASDKQILSVETVRIQQLKDRKASVLEQQNKIENKIKQINLEQISNFISELQNKKLEKDKELFTKQAQLKEKVSRANEIETFLKEVLIKERALIQNIQDAKVNLASLEAQQKSPGESEQILKIEQWLKQSGFENSSRLREIIQVDEGWEKAVELVLKDILQAICVENFDKIAFANINDLQGQLSFIQISESQEASNHKSKREYPYLIEKIKQPLGINTFLKGIYVTETFEDAIALLPKLSFDESVVTRSGIWCHANWLKIDKEYEEKQSILVRQKNIASLKNSIVEIEEALNVERINLDENQNYQLLLQQEINQYQKELNEIVREQSTITSQLNSNQEKSFEMKKQSEELVNESELLSEKLNQIEKTLQESNIKLNNSTSSIKQLEDAVKQLITEKQQLELNIQNLAQMLEREREIEYQWTLKEQAILAESKAFSSNLERTKELLRKVREKKLHLENQLLQGDSKHSVLTKLEELRNRQNEAEEKFQLVEKRIESLRNDVEQFEEQRLEVSEKIENLNLSSQKFHGDIEAQKARLQNLDEQIHEISLSDSEMSELENKEIDEETCESTIKDLNVKIQRLGPINLAAIDEYQAESARYEYYLKQSDDLTTALETLQSAMRKIDQETKTRFKSTFEEVNKNFQLLFPKLFGGGNGALSLTSDDWLEAGVSINARPPGKKVSNIQALSGGEKALTAVSLILSIFQLNPSPFCMLDEVDAPLDDANVLRYCEVIREMSKVVQFIFITHNKVTMEMAEQLTGVTMNEPGVSRLVSVDVESLVSAA